MIEQDRILMKNFVLVVAGLIVFTIVIVIVVLNLNTLTDRPDNPEVQANIEKRLAPPGDVYVGDEPVAAVDAPEEGSAAATAPAAFDGSLDAQIIYDNVCKACHEPGVAGSPMLVRSEWEDRLEQGMDTLVQHAIDGYQGPAGYMPPKGGRVDLSDEQIRVTVQWMVDSLE